MAGVHAMVGRRKLGSATINITTRTVSRTANGSTATASYNLMADGNVQNHSGTVLEQWCNPPEFANLYEARATFQSGNTVPSGTLDTWLALSTNRGWSVVNSLENNTTKSGVILVEIRLASTGTVLDSATITINATSNEGACVGATVTL